MNRRTALVGLGGAMLGASATGIGIRAASAEGEPGPHTPLPFYGGFASAIRPDLGRPTAAGASIVWRADRSDRTVALTFDDGPRPDWTPRVLDALAAEDVPATFFVKGVNVRDHGPLHANSIGRHEIGNHTWDHPDLARLDLKACTEQLARTTAAIHAAYGIVPALFRPPYGHAGGSAILAAAQAGLTTVFWSAQFRENLYVQRPEGIIGGVAGQVHPGAIVLGHDTGPRVRLVAIDNLRGIIGRLKDMGYTFHTVSELLAGARTPATR
ncbi:MAG: polysaccharide deacetylase family protein [Nostocoides sp.]